MLKWCCLLWLCVLTAGCGKDDGSYIPSVTVNFQSPLADPKLTQLGSAGGAVVINGYGVAGLIIYRTGGGSYVAYDRCSSYQPEKRCAVVIDDTGLTATDPCSGSKFLLSDGSPVKAPATRSLKPYSVYVNNFNIFVSN
jgi:nitrite reductase/ring-hydroxylating ferredoxin subunit